MKEMSKVRLAILALTLSGLLAGPAFAEVKPVLGGALRTLCASGIAAHPKSVKIATVIADERFESSEKVVIAAFYGPHPATQGPRGRVRAKATLLKEDGTLSTLRTLRGRQDAANAELLLIKQVSTSLEAGDVILWNFKLRGFGELANGCFEIAAAVGPHE